jgi:hypothetical protein
MNAKGHNREMFLMLCRKHCYAKPFWRSVAAMPELVTDSGIGRDTKGVIDDRNEETSYI